MGPSQSGKTHLISQMSKLPINDTTIIGADMILASMVIDGIDHDIIFFDTSGTVRFLDMARSFDNMITVFVVIINNYIENYLFYKKLKEILNTIDRHIIFVNGADILHNVTYNLFNVKSCDLISINDTFKIQQKILSAHKNKKLSN